MTDTNTTPDADLILLLEVIDELNDLDADLDAERTAVVQELADLNAEVAKAVLELAASWWLRAAASGLIVDR